MSNFVKYFESDDELGQMVDNGDEARLSDSENEDSYHDLYYD